MFANFSLDILSLIQSFKDQWILSVSEVPVPAPNTKIPTLFKGDFATKDIGVKRQLNPKMRELGSVGVEKGALSAPQSFISGIVKEGKRLMVGEITSFNSITEFAKVLN